MTKLVYKPFGIVLGILSGIVGKTVFKRLWALIPGQNEPPRPTQRDQSWAAVIAAAALGGAMFAALKAAADRGGAQTFYRVTGRWPGEEADDRA